MIVKILDNLKALGYSVTLEGDNIRLRYLGQGEHPAEAKPFTEELKNNKAQAISYLRAQDSPNKALSLHDEGVSIHKMPLSEFGEAGITLKIWSEVLNDHILFISDDAVITLNPLDLVAYTAMELTAMLDMEPEEVQAAHEVKRAFHRTRVIKHRVNHGQL